MASSLYFIVVLCGLWIAANAQCQDDCEPCKGCPSGWTKFEDKCYLFTNSPKTWTEAETTCLDQGANLASFRNEAIYNFIRQIVKTATNKDERVWVGAHDTTNEGVWLWSDGSVFAFTGWGANQPDNAGAKEHCMELNYNGATNDVPCNLKRGFVCGMPEQDVTS
ncbi:galactose-specific lectin nattectin-like [Centropristis striata]|uniref:galactose-specific lectin nattectin-like n=1 Tax=Centropristis striata TaxID=184440 RepID=UPI0027E0ED36|nr:galactose-specific lectin nattectin-like [Centropristis striata]